MISGGVAPSWLSVLVWTVLQAEENRLCSPLHLIHVLSVHQSEPPPSYGLFVLHVGLAFMFAYTFLHWWANPSQPETARTPVYSWSYTIAQKYRLTTSLNSGNSLLHIVTAFHQYHIVLPVYFVFDACKKFYLWMEYQCPFFKNCFSSFLYRRSHGFSFSTQ